jgi:hypothetical protein
MNMPEAPTATPRGTAPRGRLRRAPLLRLAAACALGFAAALLVSCGSSGKGLIPSASASPLQSDFQEVSQVAQSGNCPETETKLAKTEQDFNALPATVDSGLRSTLRQGIVNLRSRALVLCSQPLATTTGTTAKTTTTPTNTVTTPTTTATTPTTTQTTPTETTPPTTTTPPGPGGGTAAPGETEAGKGNGDGGGVGPGGQGPPGQEGGK